MPSFFRTAELAADGPEEDRPNMDLVNGQSLDWPFCGLRLEKNDVQDAFFDRMITFFYRLPLSSKLVFSPVSVETRTIL